MHRIKDTTRYLHGSNRTETGAHALEAAAQAVGLAELLLYHRVDRFVRGVHLWGLVGRVCTGVVW